MKTLILFYSYTGHTKKLAEEMSAKESADIAEIKDAKRPGKLKAYCSGCFNALRGKAWPIQPIAADLAAYDRIKICSPVWAGNLPPAVNAALEKLPGGKTVSFTLASASGKSDCRAKIETAVKSKGCTLEGFMDVKA